MSRIRISKKSAWSFLIIMIFIVSLKIVFAPSPHDVQGQIFTESGNSVSNEIIVTINDTATGDFVIAYTNGAGVYSATISGDDGDAISVISWNETHYGINMTVLAAGTTEANIKLNYTRGSEANATIIYPLNNSIKERNVPFNVTANVTILGANGTQCNATIEFANQSTNVTADQNITNMLGNITLNDSKLTVWNVTGKHLGQVNISVNAVCLDDTVLWHLNSYTITITINATVYPAWQNPEVNTTYVQQFDFLKFNATWTDEIGLSAFIFSANSSGIWVNYSNVSFSGVGNASNFTMQINSSAYSVVGWAFFANNTQDNFNSTNISIFTIVPQYHIFHGLIGSEITLDNLYNRSIMSWSNDTNVKGNLYVVDSDTKDGISWPSLYAIGKDTSLNDIQNDWEDIDAILMFTPFGDSINRSFTSQYQPKEKANFTVSANLIENVSVINSTNSSNFITGLLWDASDSSDSQYDQTDREDIVFVTKIDGRKDGFYGIYNYEIRIPARAKQYQTPNNDDTVSLYVELA